MICFELGHNFEMETLNLSLTTGLTEYGVRTLMLAMYKLNSLNISWAGLQSDAITSLVKNAPINLMRLNIAGCRKVLVDSRKSQYIYDCLYQFDAFPFCKQMSQFCKNAVLNCWNWIYRTATVSQIMD